jgi:hypothetical protein
MTKLDEKMFEMVEKIAAGSVVIESVVVTSQTAVYSLILSRTGLADMS